MSKGNSRAGQSLLEFLSVSAILFMALVASWSLIQKALITSKCLNRTFFDLRARLQNDPTGSGSATDPHRCRGDIRIMRLDPLETVDLSSESGAYHFLFAVFMSAWVAVACGTLTYQEAIRRRIQVVNALDRCSGRAVQSMKRELIGIQNLNRQLSALRVTREALLLSAQLPEAEALVPPMQGLRTLLQAKKISWQAKRLEWTIGRFCPQVRRTFLPLPDLPLNESPDDWIGPKPLEIQDAKVIVIAQQGTWTSRAQIQTHAPWPLRWIGTGID